jgi:hypothetical protein
MRPEPRVRTFGSPRTERIAVRPPLLLLALTWVPFVSLFAFASPAVSEALGDSYPHMAFHVASPALLATAFLVARRFRGVAPTRLQRTLTGVLLVTLPLAVLGNLLELAAAVRRFAEDGWVSRPTPDIFEGGGAHAWAANLTVPAHMLSMLVVLVLVVTAAVQGSRRLEVAR